MFAFLNTGCRNNGKHFHLKMTLLLPINIENNSMNSLHKINLKRTCQLFENAISILYIPLDRNVDIFGLDLGLKNQSSDLK